MPQVEGKILPGNGVFSMEMKTNEASFSVNTQAALSYDFLKIEYLDTDIFKEKQRFFNPLDTILQIEFILTPTHYGPLTVQVYNSEMHLISTHKAVSGYNAINIEANDGMYYVKAIDSQEIYSKETLVFSFQKAVLSLESKLVHSTIRDIDPLPSAEIQFTIYSTINLDLKYLKFYRVEGEDCFLLERVEYTNSIILNKQNKREVIA